MYKNFRITGLASNPGGHSQIFPCFRAAISRSGLCGRPDPQLASTEGVGGTE